jgi:ABC-type dipeptide/oligopeptide/nickel transport system permease subunit
MLYGIRISMLVGVAASFVGTVVGAMLGLVSGYWGGKTDAIVQRIVDILMSFPLIILALTLLTALAPSLPTVIIAIGVPFIPYGARVVRASTMVIKESQYVEAARAIGCSDLRIIFRHIAPGCVALYIVLTTGLIGVAIITESALGFLGLSIPPPTPTLGAMLSEALTLLMFAPHVAIVPGVAITLVVFAFNILGDSLRDVLDPRLRGSG